MKCMKTIVIYLAAIVCVFSLHAQEQKSYRGQILVKQDSFLVKQDLLYLNMNIEISGLAVGRYEKLILTPVLRFKNEVVSLQPIVLNGANKHKMYKRAIALDGPVIAKEGAFVVLKNEPELIKEIAYVQSVPYKEWMKDAELVLIGELCNYAGTPKQVLRNVLTEKIVIYKE